MENSKEATLSNKADVQKAFNMMNPYLPQEIIQHFQQYMSLE